MYVNITNLKTEPSEISSHIHDHEDYLREKYQINKEKKNQELKDALITKNETKKLVHKPFLACSFACLLNLEE